jgi:Mn2+/Fe2+ NRAMP family transporter
MASSTKKAAEISLGIVTGIGGFLEAGSVATSTQAGAEFGYKLIWVLVLGIVSLAFLMEMTGRLAAISKQTYADLLRRRFGIRFFLLPLIAVFAVSVMVLISEIGGVSIALELLTGISFQWWAIPVALAGWLMLWLGTFGIVEQGSAIFGLVALAFAVAAFKMHPDWNAVSAGLVPSGASGNHARYWYLAVSILGASVSPYLYLFYSAGAVEDGWDQEYLVVNRITSGVGNLFGGTLAISVLILAALVFGPSHTHIAKYEQIALLLSTPLGHLGLLLFVATLFITCFGATLEITLSIAYLLAQGFGWEWSENLRPGRDSRFATVYSVAIIAAAIPIAIGADPLAVTNISMVLTAASLPFTVIPLFILMNDSNVMGRHCNGWLSNGALIGISVMSLILFFVSLPLQLTAGG